MHYSSIYSIITYYLYNEENERGSFVMEKLDRENDIIVSTINSGEEELEFSLRPQKLAQYIGQDKLKEKMSIYEKIFYKNPDPIEMYINNFNDFPDMNAQILFNSLKNILASQNKNENNTVRLILKDKVTIEQKLHELEDLLRKNKSFYFERLFSVNTTKHEIIIALLALLELMKRRVITLEQSKNFDIILIKSI